MDKPESSGSRLMQVRADGFLFVSMHPIIMIYLEVSKSLKLAPQSVLIIFLSFVATGRSYFFTV